MEAALSSFVLDPDRGPRGGGVFITPERTERVPRSAPADNVLINDDARLGPTYVTVAPAGADVFSAIGVKPSPGAAHPLDDVDNERVSSVVLIVRSIQPYG